MATPSWIVELEISQGVLYTYALLQPFIQAGTFPTFQQLQLIGSPLVTDLQLAGITVDPILVASIEQALARVFADYASPSPAPTPAAPPVPAS